MAIEYPDLLNTSILELQKGLNAGHWTSVDLIKAYTARVEEVDPVIHAVIALNPDALALAASCDAQRASSPSAARSPLFGIPLLIKDNIATKKMDCTAGSLALVGAKTASDSTVVRKLKEAGAIIFGRANLSEWAYFRSWENSSGFSGVNGQTYCAFHPQGDPSGSSSGSGAAMAVGLAAATIGSETSGSIISPSTRNNCVGMKPTIGLVSRTGVVPISASQDSAGPMCATVDDCAIILDAIAGPDPKDSATSKAPTDRQPGAYLAAALDLGAIKRARIGVSHQFRQSLESFIKEDLDSADRPKFGEKVPPSPYISKTFDEAVEKIRALGVDLVEVELEWNDELSKQLEKDEFQVLISEFKVDVNAYLGELEEVPTGCKTLEDLIQFNIDHKEQEMPERNAKQDIFEKALLTKGLDEPVYVEARERCLRHSTKEGLDKLFADNKLDAVITFSDSDASPGKLVTWLAAMSGYPLCCVPLGFLPEDTEPTKVLPLRRAANFPFGLIMVGLPWTEAKLFSYAKAIEEVTQVRKAGKPFEAAIPRTNLKNVVEVRAA
ncbi:amidase signature enzyme [Dacryopinax primogenitus]|uniref:Amidase signature enzyme n=1 Tax=Dacryopinax primogenitus (strain DJM 731) TaxID=1858805 RepID=M5G9F3_DACPD|nr:amidase signature enzyme [Dacryopinax primogenitus]EJU02492.1 amidase signature enzyme [Dacryopinax primogenitus]